MLLIVVTIVEYFAAHTLVGIVAEKEQTKCFEFNFLLEIPEIAAQLPGASIALEI